jgi:hypothetical protein
LRRSSTNSTRPLTGKGGPHVQLTELSRGMGTSLLIMDGTLLPW